jgi:hypothetical protein
LFSSQNARKRPEGIRMLFCILSNYYCIRGGEYSKSRMSISEHVERKPTVFLSSFGSTWK